MKGYSKTLIFYSLSPFEPFLLIVWDAFLHVAIS